MGAVSKTLDIILNVSRGPDRPGTDLAKQIVHSLPGMAMSGLTGANTLLGGTGSAGGMIGALGSLGGPGVAKGAAEVGNMFDKLASFTAKANPALFERYEYTLNDLQGSIGRAFQPVLKATIPLVRSLADSLMGLEKPMTWLVEKAGELSGATQTASAKVGPGIAGGAQKAVQEELDRRLAAGEITKARHAELVGKLKKKDASQGVGNVGRAQYMGAEEVGKSAYQAFFDMQTGDVPAETLGVCKDIKQAVLKASKLFTPEGQERAINGFGAGGDF